MHSYIVTAYSLRGRPSYDGRKTEVTAPSAEIAIDTVMKAKRYASKTKRWQRHPDPVVRDNAHWQVDLGGFCGASAVRREIADLPAETIDAQQAAAISA